MVNQSRRPDRVVVLENCSTDKTYEIVRDFEREGIECRQLQNHINGGENYNLALTYAEETDVLHILTADDLIKPNFMERLLEPLKTVKGNALAYSAFEVIDANGSLVEDGDLVNFFPIEMEPQVNEISLANFLAKQAVLKTVCTPAVLMKTDRRRVPFELCMDYIQCADAVFFSEITSEYKRFFEISEALCQYRRHDSSVTSRNRLRPDALVNDFWRATSRVDEIRGYNGPLSRFRRKCFIAATTGVLLRGIDELDHEQQRNVVQTAKGITGECAWVLGNLAIALKRFFGHARH